VFNVGAAVGYLKLNTAGWDAPMRNAGASIQAITRTFTRMGIVAVGSLLLIEREFGKFDKAIRHATSVSETTEAQFKKMAEMALDASVQWNKAAASTAQAFYYLGSAGLTVTEQLAAFNDTIMLSRAMGSELSMTVEGLVDIVRAFGLEFSNTREIADQLTKTVISSNQNFRDLDQALSYGASTARLTNNTLAETSAMLGVMANAGIKGSMAGTVLRRAMTNLMSPTSQMGELIHELGVNIYNTSTGQMRPFIDIMGDLGDRLAGTSDRYRNMVFEVLFGRRAIAGQIQLFNYGSAALRRYAEEIKNAGGTTERVAGKQMKAFTEVLGQMWQEVRRVAITLGELLAPAIERVADRMRGRLGVFREYIKANSETITEMMKWTAVFGLFALFGPPIVLVLTNLVTQIGALAKALVTGTIAVLTNPFLILLASLYTLRAVLKKQEMWDDLWSGFESSLDNISDYAQTKFKAIGWMFIKTLAAARTGKSMWGDWSREREHFDAVWEEELAYRFGKVEEIGEAIAKKTADVGLTILDAVKESLGEDIPAIFQVFTNTVSRSFPTLDALIEKFKSVIAIATEMYTVFTTAPSKFGLAMPGFAGDNEEMAWMLKRAKADMEIRIMMQKLRGEASIWSVRWHRAMEQVMDDMVKWHDLFVEMGDGVRSNWAGTIESLMNGGLTFRNFMKQMLLDVWHSFTHLAAQVAASKLFAAFFPDMYSQFGAVAGKQEILGSNYFSKQFNTPFPIPSSITNTPDIGMFSGGGALQKNISIELKNDTGIMAKITSPQTKWDGKRYVVQAVLEAYDADPNFRERLRR